MDLEAFNAELDRRPRLRGRLHLVAAVAAVAGLVVLVRSAHDTVSLVAAWVYGLTAVGLYVCSSGYHVFARSPRTRAVMQRVDHSMIYVLIAGTFTPVALLTLDGPIRVAALAAMWLGALFGVVLKVLWFQRFHRLGGALYLGLGWAGLAVMPALWARPTALLLIGAAGLLYTVGAILFALHRPRGDARWFGYHEVWHTFVVAAGVLCFVANLGLVRSP